MLQSIAYYALSLQAKTARLADYMCPKDFAIVCIINTLLVPASPFMR